MSAALHAHTPTLTVLDPRGLPVRSMPWCRTDSETEVESRVTHWRLDTAGRTVEQRDPRLFATSASRPNLATVYSLSGNVLLSDSVDAGWHAVLLSGDGLPVEQQDSRNNRMRHEYDELRRVAGVFEAFAEQIECCTERFLYGDEQADPTRNLRQQLLRHDDPAGTRHMGAYAVNGLLQQEVQHFLTALETPDWPKAVNARDTLLEPGDGMLSQWAYSPWGEQLGRVAAAGNEHRQQLDVAGRLIASTLRPSAQSEPITLVEQIRYNAFDQIEVQLAGNGLISENSYDPANGKLTRLRCSPGNNAPALQDLVYAYDPVGNVVRQEDLTIATRYLSNQRIDAVSTFTYDSLYQLTEATGRERLGAGLGPELPGVIDFSGNDSTLIGTYTRRYQYDAGGNLRVMQHQGQNGQAHRLEMAVSEFSNKSIPWREGLGSEDIENAFDPNGNLAQLQPGQNMNWDLRNQLAQVTLIARENGQHDVERYVYGGGGKRLRKYATKQASGVMHHSEVRYLPGLELHEDSATGGRWQVVNIETGRGSARWMHWLSPPPSGLSENALYFGFDNRLGSVTLETDELGQLVSREEYYPFGGTALIASRNEVEVSYKTIRYSSKERDATGLYYYGYRYLAPWLGRWLNPDPAGTVDGLNVFGFVGNNPLTWRDGDGRIRVRNPFEDDYDPNADQPTVLYVVTDETDQWLRGLINSTEERPADAVVMGHARTGTADVAHVLEGLSPTYLPPQPPELPTREHVHLPAQTLSTSSNNQRTATAQSGLEIQRANSPAPAPSRTTQDQAHLGAAVAESSRSIGQQEPTDGARTNKPHACEHCDKSFHHHYELEDHQWHHTGVKRHPCTVCGVRLVARKHLQVHLLSHFDAKVHACPYCGNRFVQKAHLKTHLRVHTGEKPYVCKICKHAFAQSTNLKIHMQKHK